MLSLSLRARTSAHTLDHIALARPATRSGSTRTAKFRAIREAGVRRYVLLAGAAKYAKCSEMTPFRFAAAGALLLLSSCSSDATAPTEHPDTGGDLSDVIYVGEVTDEALDRLLDATPTDDPRHALKIDSPDLSAPLPQDSAATFAYSPASEATRAPNHRRVPARQQPSKWQRAVHALGKFLSPEGTAYAHGAPYNGTAYYLVISDADSKTRLQVFTSETSFTPEAVDWQNLAQAPQPLKLEITSAYFEQNEIPAGEGPFVGGTFP